LFDNDLTISEFATIDIKDFLGTFLGGNATLADQCARKDEGIVG
jgi:hypothetical protein